MKYYLLLVLVLQVAGVCGAAEEDRSPMAIVRERNRALNAHELESFLATYADDVVIYVYPSKKIGDGKRHLRKIFSLFIEHKNVHTSVKKTMSSDGYVVVESETTFGKTTEAGIAIYEVRKGKIQSVRFLRDTVQAKQTTGSE